MSQRSAEWLFARVVGAVLTATILVAVTACGTLSPNVGVTAVGSIGSSPTVAMTIASPSTVELCQADQLALGQDRYRSGGGAGHQWIPWSITNVSQSPCVVDGGVPRLGFDNALGQPAVAWISGPFQSGPLAVISKAPLTLRPGGSIWFFTDGASFCEQPYQTLSGGPFSDVVTLPVSHIQLHWADSGLAQTTLPGTCPTFRTVVSRLQTTELTVESEVESSATPVATP
jgi:hypothetical protein